MNNDNLQNTLYHLAQSGSFSNPAYHTLLHDYTTYHAVLFIEGSIFTLLLMALSVYLWQKFGRMPKNATRNWTFEKTTYFSFGLVSAVVMLFMLLIVTANLSNVLNPQDGFIQSIPDLGTPQEGTQKAALYQAVDAWAQSGTFSSATGGWFNTHPGCSGTFCSKYYYTTARTNPLYWGKWTPNTNSNTRATFLSHPIMQLLLSGMRL